MEIKINKWGLIKIKNFCTEGYKQDEKTTLRMGEIIPNGTTDKGLVSKIYNQLMKLNIRKTTQSKVKDIVERLWRKGNPLALLVEM